MSAKSRRGGRHPNEANLGIEHDVDALRARVAVLEQQLAGARTDRDAAIRDFKTMWHNNGATRRERVHDARVRRAVVRMSALIQRAVTMIGWDLFPPEARNHIGDCARHKMGFGNGPCDCGADDFMRAAMIAGFRP